ncbi:MAG: hypothetical protein GX941_04720 [Candidatus Methanofastidiosa archaeon]|nr:hypothetical protein [Candidatus Methanofastidiosa archaeon]
MKKSVEEFSNKRGWELHQYTLIFTFLIIGILILMYVLKPEMFKLIHFVKLDSLMLFVQVLSTIFAITISITLVVFQYIQQDLTPELLKSITKRKFILLLLFLYPLSIIFISFVLFYPMAIPNDLENLIYFGIFIDFVFCILYLIFYLLYFNTIIKPTSIIEEVSNNIKGDFYNEILKGYPYPRCGNDSFFLIEQIIIKAIRQNDSVTYLKGIGYIFDSYNSILFSYSFSPKYNDDEIEKIDSFFSGILERISIEISVSQNLQYLSYFLVGLGDFITRHILVKKIQFFGSYNLFLNLNNSSLKSNTLSVVLKKTIIILKEMIIESLKYSNSSEYSYINNLIDDILLNIFKYINRIIETKEFDLTNDFKRQILEIMIAYRKSNLLYKEIIIGEIMDYYIKLHEVDYKYNKDYFFPSPLYFLLGEMPESEANDIGKELMNYSWKASFNNMKESPEHIFSDLFGQGFLNLEKYPLILNELIDNLEEYLNDPNNKDLDFNTKLNICMRLSYSLVELNKYKTEIHNNIKLKINSMLKEHCKDYLPS